MLALLLLGKEFGVSSNLRTMCTLVGAGRRHDFFRIDWRAQTWNLVFAAGAILGGFIATTWLANPDPVAISAETTAYLNSVGIDYPAGEGFVPDELYAMDRLLQPLNWLFLVVGGFLIGFGTRWAGGCTSGHAISGLANLQLPSLVAVIGFFIGGLVMTWLILPFLLPYLTAAA
ncbi:YeeE/YedE family protein [Neolewinella litorea]|uniref:YeeE/YedE family protein n=2 Tax=Neolewinella litorea TaxID=2562452 RepID=A0A4V3XKR5_9BACT|nr:YeeE/YedE family protein [Neolewinella litorea]